MKPGQQQNRRMRGRGNNNRKGPNSLSRNYESNGPDVKIRGNAQHIAEKYTTLARDAQACGDRVMAENYLQHAEHYNRIIMSVQVQAPVQLQRDTIGDEDKSEDEEEEEREEGYDQYIAPLRPVSHKDAQPETEDMPIKALIGEDKSEPLKPSKEYGRNQSKQRQRSLQRHSSEPMSDEIKTSDHIETAGSES